MSKLDLSPDLQRVIQATANTVIKALLAEQPAVARVRPRLLSVKDTCVHLNCSRATLHRLRAKRCAGAQENRPQGSLREHRRRQCLSEGGSTVMRKSCARTARAPPWGSDGKREGSL